MRICLPLFSLLLAACGEEAYVASPPWKETDKTLTCEQLQLEMNDARYWQGVAQSKKKMGIADVLWLPGYFGTVKNADLAIFSTNARLNYLGNIYKIIDYRTKPVEGVKKSFINMV